MTVVLPGRCSDDMMYRPITYQSVRQTVPGSRIANGSPAAAKRDPNSSDHDRPRQHRQHDRHRHHHEQQEAHQRRRELGRLLERVAAQPLGAGLVDGLAERRHALGHPGRLGVDPDGARPM